MHAPPITALVERAALERHAIADDGGRTISGKRNSGRLRATLDYIVEPRTPGPGAQCRLFRSVVVSSEGAQARVTLISIHPNLPVATASGACAVPVVSGDARRFLRSAARRLRAAA